MHEQWTGKLSDFLNGDLPLGERKGVERHLAECASCTTVLAELRAVVAKAGQLGELPPERDLWPGVAARIGSSTVGPSAATAVRPLRSRRVSFSVPQLVAASVALVAIGAASVWLSRLVPAGTEAPPGAAAPLPAGSAQLVSDAGASFGETSAAIAELEKDLTESRERLDPETLAVIEENLAVIDIAIEEIRRALVQDPASTYLNLYMAETLQRKLEVLRQVGELSARAQ